MWRLRRCGCGVDKDAKRGEGKYLVIFLQLNDFRCSFMFIPLDGAIGSLSLLRSENSFVFLQLID